jgi:hypothetical protein
MDNRFQGGETIENGGMFTREKINQITQYSPIYLGSSFLSTETMVSWDRKISLDAW